MSAHLKVSQEGAHIYNAEPYEMPLLYPAINTILYYILIICKLFLYSKCFKIYLMYYPHMKEIAKNMRKNGASLGDISKKLNIAKSTLSFWCKDMVLPESAF